jgi:hypothetical protein
MIGDRPTRMLSYRGVVDGGCIVRATMSRVVRATSQLAVVGTEYIRPAQRVSNKMRVAAGRSSYNDDVSECIDLEPTKVRCACILFVRPNRRPRAGRSNSQKHAWSLIGRTYVGTASLRIDPARKRHACLASGCTCAHTHSVHK